MDGALPKLVRVCAKCHVPWPEKSAAPAAPIAPAPASPAVAIQRAAALAPAAPAWEAPPAPPSPPRAPGYEPVDYVSLMRQELASIDAAEANLRARRVYLNNLLAALSPRAPDEAATEAPPALN